MKMTFEQFDNNNPQVWDLFMRFTFDTIHAGHKRFSADSILHRIRWETSVVTTDAHFKINNDYSADYARKFMTSFPKYNNFFEIRNRHYGNQ
jgi:hypothetical protein